MCSALDRSTESPLGTSELPVSTETTYRSDARGVTDPASTVRSGISPSALRRAGVMTVRASRLLCLSVLAGGAFGVVALLLNNGAAGGWRIPGIVLETRSAWCAAPFFAGVVARIRLRAFAAGLLVELSALLAYYVARHVLDAEPWDQVWAAFRPLADLGVLIGPLLGVLGSFARSGGPWRHVWRMTIPGLAAIEAGVNLKVAGSDRLSNDVSLAQLVLSCALVVGLAARAAIECQSGRARPVIDASTQTQTTPASNAAQIGSDVDTAPAHP